MLVEEAAAIDGWLPAEVLGCSGLGAPIIRGAVKELAAALWTWAPDRGVTTERVIDGLHELLDRIRQVAAEPREV